MGKIIKLVITFIVIVCPGISIAALPPVVEGKPLPSLAPMLENTTPGVVNIATRGKVQVQSSPFFDDPFFRRFFDIPSRPRERLTQSLGSGVIVDARRGYILTNHHVIASAQEISVTLSDGRQLDAKLVGTDPDSDVAVIQVDVQDDITAVAWGDSDRLRVGDFVVAIGNPFGLGQTVTSGIVSALGRSGLGIEAYEDFIQTDASINPGNSGGALVNLNGELIGINTAIIGPSGGNVGIGFAIPSMMAKSIMEQLIAHGEVRRGRLGVVVQDLTSDLAKAFGLKNKKGVVVTQVEHSSPAAKVGLRPGDIVVAVDDRVVRSSYEMRNIVGLQRIGQVIEMTVMRNGSKKRMRVVIEEPKLNAINGEKIHPRLTGALIGNPDPALVGGQFDGVMVLEVEYGSMASAAGIREGDIIVSVNRKIVKTVEDIKKATDKNNRSILLNIQRGDTAMFLVIR